MLSLLGRLKHHDNGLVYILIRPLRSWVVGIQKRGLPPAHFLSRPRISRELSLKRRAELEIDAETKISFPQETVLNLKDKIDNGWWLCSLQVDFCQLICDKLSVSSSYSLGPLQNGGAGLQRNCMVQAAAVDFEITLQIPLDDNRSRGRETLALGDNQGGFDHKLRVQPICSADWRYWAS